MDIDDFFVFPEHLERCSYEVLMRHCRYAVLDLGGGGGGGF